MISQPQHLPWWQRQSTSFWAAATVGVPVLLSAGLLLAVPVKLLFDASGVSLLGSGFAVVAAVELILVLVSVLLFRRRSAWTTGAALAGGIAGVFLLAATSLRLVL